MTGTWLVSPLLEKEFRALAPVWLASAAAITASALMGNTPLWSLGVSAFVLGAITLGALSIGHEYTCRTLDQLLSQPGDRRRLLLAKVVVLVALLAALGALVAMTLLRPESWGRHDSIGYWGAMSILLLPLLSGLVVAPWLTMLSRSPIAGVVFTLTIPVAIWVGSNALVAEGHRFEYRTLAFNLAVLWAGMLAVSAVATVLGWRKFVRLEAIGGHDELYVPGLSRRAGVPSAAPAGTIARRPRRPLAALLRKELRLQSATLLVAAVYVLAWAVMSLMKAASYRFESVFFALTNLFGGLVAMLAGALASAEERGLGTIESQLVQPYARWKQWVIKVGATLALTLVLAVVLPVVLAAINPIGRVSNDAAWILRSVNSTHAASTIAAHVAILMFLTICAMYVSSLYASGLRALLLSFSFVTVAVVAFGAVAFATYAAWRASRVLWTALDIQVFERSASAEDTRWMWLAEQWLALATGVGFALLLLRFVFANHFLAERGPATTRRQVSWLAAYVIGGAAVTVVLPRLLWGIRW